MGVSAENRCAVPLSLIHHRYEYHHSPDCGWFLVFQLTYGVSTTEMTVCLGHLPEALGELGGAQCSLHSPHDPGALHWVPGLASHPRETGQQAASLTQCCL